jgi:hypothetical protein
MSNAASAIAWMANATIGWFARELQLDQMQSSEADQFTLSRS